MFHANISIYTVCIIVTFWAAVLPEAEGSLAWQDCPGLGAWGGAGGRTPEAAQVGQIAPGAAWWSFNAGDCSTGWQEKPRPITSLLFLLHLSVLTGVSRKSSRKKYATQALLQLLLSNKVNIK